MMECNLKPNASDITWFVKRDLQLAAITTSNVFWLLKKLIEPTALMPQVKWPA